jgi:hypothetical protein
MSETLPTRDMRGFDSRGKFAKGNSLARGNPLNRLAQSLKAQMIRRAAKGGDVDRIYDQLLADATDPQGSGIVRVAAARVLLGYVLGKPDQTLNVSKTEGQAPPEATAEEWVERLQRAGIPTEAWPLRIREAIERKKVASRVIERPEEPT